MIEDINERMTQFAPSQNNPLNDDPIAEEIAIARQVTPQPDAATIDVDPIAEEIAQSRRDLMMATFGSAAEANPDQAAQAKKLGEQFGVGADIAGRNMQQLKKQALLDELDRRDLMRRDPILARYLSNHDFAAMAHDDIDNLAKTEDLFQGSWFARYEDPIAYGKKTISMIDERFRRGRAIVEMGRANDLLGLRAQWSPDPRKASEISEELKKLTTEGGIVGAGVEVVGQMLEGIPEVAETTAMGATAGGAVGAVGGPAGFVTIPAGMLTGAGAGFAAGSARSAFMAESGNSYQQMIEQGYDPEVARKAAIGVGVVNASIEMISFGALGPVLRKLGVNVFRPAVANALAKPTAAKALATLGGDYAKAVAAGASEEFLQEIATGIGDDIARVYGSSSPSRILDEGGITDLLGTALQSGVQGAMGMAILGGIGPVANFRYDMRRAGAAERQQAFFERLSANAVDSKLRGRDTNAFERFVASQAEGTEAETIFVDAAAMQGVLRQSNLSDEQIDEALPGIREQLQAAAQTGGDVTLPTAAFAARVAGTDLGNAMLPHVRLAPDAMSVTEAQEFQKNRDQLVEQARVIMEEKGRADDAFVQEARAIEDRIYQEVVATGTMDENAARANATFVRDLYVTMAARMNTTPAALEQRFPYRVKAQGVAITEPLEQAATMDAEYMAAVERGDMATAQQQTDATAERSFPESVVRGDGDIGTAGKILRVYHGSGAFIRQFMYEFTGQGVDQLGSGFYFTTDRPEAESYMTRRRDGETVKIGGESQPTVVEAYLDIRNPLRADKVGSITREQVRKFIAAAPEETRREGLENWGIDGDVPSAKVLDAYAFKDANIVRELFKIGNDFYGRNTEAFNRAIKDVLGYDGVVQDFRADGVKKLHYVAFFPEQIKSADPVTYDEAGNVIPLSRRFDITSPRIFEQAAMSTRVPSAKGMEMAALDSMLLADWDAMKDNDKLIAGNLAKIKELGFPVKLDETKTPREQLEQFMDAVADNLDYLYEQMDSTQRERAKLWYVGARRIAEWLAARYGITDMQAAAMLAVLSPQKNWFENVSMADRIGDILTAARDERWSPEMEKNFRRMVEDVRSRVTITERQIAENEKPVRPTKPRTEESLEDFKARKKAFNARRPRLKAKYERDLAQWEQELEEYERELEGLLEAGESTTLLRADMAAHRRDRPKSPRMPGRILAESAAEFDERKKQYQDDLAEWEKRGVRLAKILKSKQEKIEYLDQLSASARMQAMRAGTLRTVLDAKDLELAGMFVRMFDEEHNDRKFAIITPEGGMAGPSMGASGPMSLRWGSYSTIQKAISVFEDGRAENVHHQIGKAHKVRNFYNNIFDPTNPNAATIDTHAIAAAALMPLSASDEIVGWGLGSGVSDAKLGLHGGYPILFEAYRRAAERREIIAREEQSITWEAIRGLFVAAEKKTLKPIIAEVWGRYMNGEISLDEARSQVFKLSNGIKTPEWVGQSASLQVGSTYSGRSRSLMDVMEPAIKRQMQQMTRLMFEIAPDLRNKNLTAAWQALPVETRYAISRDVMSKIVPEILKEFGITAAIEEQIGGWEGGTELSFAISLPSTTMVRQLSRVLRYVLQQKRMFSISEEKFEGSKLAGLVVINLQPGTTPAQIKELYEERLYKVTNLGHSTVGASMIIGLEEGVDSGDVARRIADELSDDPVIVSIKHGEAWSFNDVSKEEPIESQPIDERGLAPADQRRRLDALRTEATELIAKELRAAGLFEQAAPGPARGGFDPSRLTTILNKNADLSTFIHETAHFYLTILGNLAADPAATPEIRADMDTLLKWFGVAGDTDAARLAAWNALSVDQQRKYHEQFAYSFEVYMFEGKSPSAEMQGLFDRFSAWLKRVYRSIRDDLNAIYRREFGEDLPLLTGEVRQVMDRMLASEEQIKRQAAINEMKPMFQTQEQSGMDDAEWAAYQQMQQEAVEAAVTDMNKASLRQMQWLSNARARILRDLQAKHAKQRKEIREEVAEEIRRQPLYRAMEYLRTGTFTDADGEAVKMEGAHRLDMESVRQMYELEPENLRPDIAKLGTGGRGMMGMNGIDPDVAAELFGFSSGDELIRALIEAQPMKEAIDARTDELMLERFSELSTPEGREAKVQESLHNEARARFVAVELRFVAKATQPARVLVEAAKQAAREMIAGKRIVDLRPSEFIAAEARAARAAGKIGKPVNVDAVAQAAYTRAKNEALASGAPEDVAEAGAVVARDAARAAAQARLDEQRAQYGADPAQALIRAKRAQLYQNQLAAEALAARDEVEKGVRYLRQVMRDSNVKRMGADVADQIDRILERFNLRPMSAKRMAERQSLVQWLESLKESGLEPDLAPEILDEAARKPYREMTVAEFRDLVDAVKQLEYIGKNAQKIKRAQEMAEFEEVRDEIVASVRGNFTGKETKPRTPTTSMGKRIAKAKRFLYSHLKAAAIARIMDGGQDDGPVWNFLIRTANEAGDMETKMRAEATKRLTEILAPVFALGKMGGKGIYFDTVGMSLNREARLVIALNMGNDGNRQRLLDGEGWTLEQVQPILESLTEAEWKAVQDVWDYMESFRPLVGAKERRLYGREPKWVTPVPFTVRTADGKEVRLSGGYYPIKYDPIATERAETADEAEKARTELRGAYTAATTRRSFTKARAAKVEDRPLLYTMTGVYSGINDVIHDLAWHEWLIQANRLMRDEKFDRAVRETYGAEFKSQLKGWIKDVAAGERGSEDAADMFASYIRRSVSAAGLGFNIVSAILQVTGFSQSIVRVGAKHIARGVAATTASPLQTMKFVNEKSSFMQERARTQFRELNELRNMVGDESAAQRRLRLGTYFLMMRMQRMVDVPTWVGAYEKALEAGKDDATAVALADQAVIDSQGGGMLKDLSKIERGGALSKLFTVFYSYMNTVYNMAAVSTMTPRSRGRLAADYAMLFIVPVVLNYALKKALTPDVDDEEPDMEKIATDLVAEELAFLMGTMVGVREFQNAANAVVGKETAARGYEGPAGLRAIGEVGRFAVQAKQAEFDRAFRRSAINMLGVGLGLPSAQINRTIDGVEALAEGETENPFAVLTGVQR